MEKAVRNTLMLIKFSKEIANSFAKVTNGWKLLEVIKGKFKTLSNIRHGNFFTTL